MYTQENFKYDFPEQNINRVRDELSRKLGIKALSKVGSGQA